MTSGNKEYFVVFDTNILFQPYEKKADFTTFSFNATFKNVIDLINELDIYEKVKVAIPAVTWKEMTRQIIDAHEKKIGEFKSYVEKWILPEYSVKEQAIEDYPLYIAKAVQSYRDEISTSLNTIIELPIPSDGRFKGIVRRAFNKAPPFGGKEKNSDKGFKDVLLWESILEFVLSHPHADILFYTKDNGFKEILIDEFKQAHPQASITICSTETEVTDELNKWARDIDIYSYQPIEAYSENLSLIKWLGSSDFEIQMIDRDFGLVEKNRLIASTTLKLLSIDNIAVIQETADAVDYSVDVTLDIGYAFKGGSSIHESIEATIIVENQYEEAFFVEDAYKSDSSDSAEKTAEEIEV